MGKIWVRDSDSENKEKNRSYGKIQYIAIRLANRKAKYVHMFFMDCIGFFYLPLRLKEHRRRSPPHGLFLKTKKGHGGKREC